MLNNLEFSRFEPLKGLPKLTLSARSVIRYLLLRVHAPVGTGSDVVGKLVRKTVAQGAEIV